MISLQEYKQRRQQLAKQLSQDAIAIIPAASEIQRNADTDYRFRQNSSFFYLTGFNEPDALLCISHDGHTVLFNRPKNPAEEQWTGKRLGQNDAQEQLGVDEAYALAELETRLPTLFGSKKTIYYTLGVDAARDNLIIHTIKGLKSKVRRGLAAPLQMIDIEPLISELRLFKSEAELKIMRQVAKVSTSAHARAMRACRHLQYEYELEAELLYEFNRQGCRSVAYDSIVGSGPNACVLHYTQNDQPLLPNQLVLIDAGAELYNYASDITRTFPSSGRFTEEQKALYQLVLKAQQAGIGVIKQGTPWNVIQETIVAILTEGLCDLGILKGSVNSLIEQEAYKPFYMHNSGHWLGLDVHDCGAYKVNNNWRSLEPNMVLTVEPGLYIQKGMPNVDERWWDIGIRIEDDIVVTAAGHENLTKALPVEVAAIEALMSE